jgi:hypothetical protein
MENNNDKKTSRASQTREKTAHKKVWSPPSPLDSPPAPSGFKHRWIRAESMGFQDTKNVSASLREYSGVIGVGGLLLARIPEEIIKQRQEYYASQHNEKVKAMDNDLMKEEHPSMPIDIDRQTRVTFGGSKKS